MPATASAATEATMISLDLMLASFWFLDLLATLQHFAKYYATTFLSYSGASIIANYFYYFSAYSYASPYRPLPQRSISSQTVTYLFGSYLPPSAAFGYYQTISRFITDWLSLL
jgi:hypothetical protein